MCFLGAAVLASTDEAQKPDKAPASVKTGKTAKVTDEDMKSFRSDLQEERADIMAKNLTLTSEQAAKFWPVFQQYQKEQDVILDEQLNGVKKYVETADSLDDAGALALLNAHLDSDMRMQVLRKKYLGEFQKVMPGKMAARAIQIDRRLSLAMQTAIVVRIPLVH